MTRQEVTSTALSAVLPRERRVCPGAARPPTCPEGTRQGLDPQGKQTQARHPAQSPVGRGTVVTLLVYAYRQLRAQGERS